MANKKQTTPETTRVATIELNTTTRDDIKILAKIEARKLHMPRIANNQYITMLVEREKAKAVQNGTWDKAA